MSNYQHKNLLTRVGTAGYIYIYYKLEILRQNTIQYPLQNANLNIKTLRKQIKN